MRIDGLMQGQAANPANAMDILGRLNIGDVIKAKILEATTGELMLKLFDGSVFKAQTQADTNAVPGEMLNFKVVDKEEGRVFLEVQKNMGKAGVLDQNSLEKSLAAINVKPNSENISLAGEFQASGVKITSGLFQKALELFKGMQGLDPQKAVFLASKSVDPGSFQPDTLFKLLEGKLKIGDQLLQLQSIIKDITQDGSKNINDLKSAPKQMAAGEIAVDEGGRQIQSKQQVQSRQQDQSRQQVQSKQQNQDRQPENQPAAAKSEIASATAEKTAAVIKTETALNTKESIIINLTGREKPDISKGQKAITTSENNVPGSNNENAIPETLKVDKKGSILQQNGRKQDVDSTGLKASMENTQKGTQSAINDKLHKLQASLDDAFVKISSESLKSDIEAKKLYTDILQKLDSLKDAIHGSGIKGYENISSRIDSIQDGIRFLNQLNPSMPYVQIPLNVSGYNTNGELYVMSRDQRKKRIDPRDLVMFISLDTQNIGHIESIVDVKGRNVSISLGAGEESILAYVKDNFRELYNGLQADGYKLVDMKYRLITEPTRPIDMERTVRNSGEEIQNKLDIRI